MRSLDDSPCVQGLGFRAPLIGVLDIPKLRLIFTGVASLASAVAPAILLLGAGSNAAGTDECALSPDDISTVQSLGTAMRTVLAGRNASCEFKNMTLDEILEM